MVSVLPIDCSQYAVDIMKNTTGGCTLPPSLSLSPLQPKLTTSLSLSYTHLMTAHLSSNRPPTRCHALSLVSSLARQCSDPAPMELVLQQLFTVLKSKSPHSAPLPPPDSVTVCSDCSHRKPRWEADGCRAPLQCASRYLSISLSVTL